MIRISVIALLIVVCNAAAAQDYPKEITPAIAQKIKNDIEKKIPALRKELEARDFMTKDEVEFSLDTFRLNQTTAYCIDIDYSNYGMNKAVIRQTEGYDKLMNKYYNMLMKLLKPEDKKVLVVAQKAWLAFRDAESELINSMTKDEYSGGGTIQSNIAVGSYANMVEQRTIAIFNYYNDVIKN